MTVAALAAAGWAGGVVSAAPPEQACPWSAAAFATASAPRVPVVVMKLSPRMVYSLLEWRRMRAVATDQGFCVIPARDPRVPVSEWQQAVRRAGFSELLAAPSLADLGLPPAFFFNHAPISQVWHCGHAHSWPIFGVMTNLGWRQSLRARLTDLERDTPCDEQ